MARPYKIPESVLVVIHTPEREVLLIERADAPGTWQSVTGSLDAPDEPRDATAWREVAEETGIHVSLQQVHKLAEKVGGNNHRLKFVQLPINAVSFEAVFEEWQFLTCDLVYQDFE